MSFAVIRFAADHTTLSLAQTQCFRNVFTVKALWHVNTCRCLICDNTILNNTMKITLTTWLSLMQKLHLNFTSMNNIVSTRIDSQRLPIVRSFSLISKPSSTARTKVSLVRSFCVTSRALHCVNVYIVLFFDLIKHTLNN